jgi:hypothetical protein
MNTIQILVFKFAYDGQSLILFHINYNGSRHTFQNYMAMISHFQPPNIVQETLYCTDHLAIMVHIPLKIPHNLSSSTDNLTSEWNRTHTSQPKIKFSAVWRSHTSQSQITILINEWKGQSERISAVPVPIWIAFWGRSFTMVLDVILLSSFIHSFITLFSVYPYTGKIPRMWK